MKYALLCDQYQGWVIVEINDFGASRMLYDTQSMTMEECIRKFMMNMGGKVIIELSRP